MSKKQELEDLFNTIKSIYLKNISFLSSYNKSLLKRIQDFEQSKKENYFLEFVNNHFEIFDKNNTPIYNCDPFINSQQRVSNIKNLLSFSLIHNEYITSSVEYKEHINAYKFINEYIKLKKNETKYNKFIFLGTQLGVHLNDFDKILKSKAYLIIEDNIEIFRLSLFLTDYEELAKESKLFFCINEDNLNIKIKEFLDYKYEDNNHISFELADSNHMKYIDILTKLFIDNDPYNYPFSEILISLKRNYFYQNDPQFKILKLNKKEFFFEKPILFLGAGPSLGKNIEWIYMNQDNFIIICAAACLKRLELLGIIPDIILTIDGQQQIIKEQFEINKKYFKNSLIVSSIKTDPSVINLLNKDNCFFMQDNLGLIEDHKMFTGVTVGDIGLELILLLGAKTIYMIGFDAAITEDGKTHDSIYKNIKVRIEKDEKKNEGFNTKKDLIKVKGNFRKEVNTLMIYLQIIDSINKITNNLDKNIKIYNASDGAYFNNTIPVKKEDINESKFINKDKTHEILKKNLKNISSEYISLKNQSKLKKEEKIIKKLQLLNETNYKKEFIKLNNSYKNSLSIQILEQFLKLITPYSTYINSEESKKLEFSQFKKVVEDLKLSFKF